jgi:hypothetical protein
MYSQTINCLKKKKPKKNSNTSVRVRFDDEHYPCSSLSVFILRKQGHIYEHENKEEKERERSDEDNKEVKR